MSLPEPLFDAMAQVCIILQMDDHRTDIAMLGTVRTLVTLESRTEVGMEESRRVAELALPHRPRRVPFEQAGNTGIN